MHRLILFICLITVIAATPACRRQPPEEQSGQEQSSAPSLAGTKGRTGTVVEAVNGDGYTFILVESAGTRSWAAASEFTVKPGDQVTVPDGTVMTGYKSDALNRTFDQVLFVDSITVNQP
jgi:membrane protein implicated in regulation of membrane protease activity